MNPTNQPIPQNPQQVTYFDPTRGAQITSDIESAPPQVQQLIKQFQQSSANLQQTQAAIPGTQAESAIKTVQATQTQAPQNLSKDLGNKMTLGDAIKKYTALGMSADDVFKQYLGQSPYGMPKEDPQKLQEMGISKATLGDIGTPGSFMDRYNTKNAIEGLNKLRDLWNKTNAQSRFAGIFGLSPDTAAYETAKTIFGQHLSSLIPGASGAEGSVKGLVDTLPSSGDIREDIPGKADAQFKSIEDQLLQTKGYTHKDLGTTPVAPTTTSTSGEPSIGGFAGNVISSGKDLLNNILQTPYNLQQAAKAGKDVSPNALMAGAASAFLQSLYKDIGSPMQGGDVAGRAAENIYKNPVGVAADILPFLKAGKLGAVSKAAGEAGATSGEAATAQAAADVFKGAPGKLQQFFTPEKAKNVIGQIRDNLISNADKAGNTVTGDNLASSIRQWADRAKISNLPDANAIEEAAKNAESLYAGKVFKPSELKNIYDNIEGGYTKGGVPKSATASYIDRGVQDVLQKHLENIAPGFGKTTDLFRQTFKAEKSPVKKAAVSIGKQALSYTPLAFLSHFLQ